MATADLSITLGGYHLAERIYSGSKTVVYRGVQAVTGGESHSVVIKLLQQDYPTFNDLLQFRNQYTIAKNLDIPGIVRPLCLENYRHSYALVMEDFGGLSLREHSQNHTLSLVEVLDIALQLCDILHHLHHNRVIHKDIKPANILLHPQTKQVKLIDFSIASLLPKETQEIKNPNGLEGTLAYLSPEQTGRMNRGIDYRADFYALGVTLFELLTGELPFQSDDPMELVHCHIAKVPPALGNREEMPQVVSDIVMKLMAKNAEERYQSALGLKYDLEICRRSLQQTGKIADFIIAQRDVSDRFLIPEKLYGREAEVNHLLSAFERVAQGSTEIILVAGFSGIGKTAVVNEIHKPIVRQRGYFIKGKFDQFNRNIPFSAFVQAFRDLMGQLLSESDAQLEQWKAKIIAALGESGQVMIDVIPELESIIGKQPPVPELSGSAAQNRFNLLFQKFIQLFTNPEHPLVIFLDDLQWADLASLKLMQLLMHQGETGYLLLIGAYRDNEVFAAHPLMLTVDEMEKAGVTVNTMTLAPLILADINQLVADTLSCQIELAQTLTELVYSKTKGNPFFTTQLLKFLHEDGLIAFNQQVRYWECDIAQVRTLALTDDVVEFMALQLQKLPQATQNLLKIAACIGNKFDLATLAIVWEKSQFETATDLWKALQEGLILPESEIYKFFQTDGDETLGFQTDPGQEKTSEQLPITNYQLPNYKFLHDRVQQAAYCLIPDDKKQATHLKIGQLLLKNTSVAEQEERIFEIVSQLNYGINLIALPAEQKNLAELNLMAGKKAKASTAYAAAVEYLNQGLSLLETESWQHSYALTLALHTEAMEAEYLNGNVERSQTLAETVLQNASSQLDAIKVYETKIQIYITSMQASAAIDAGLQALELIGLSLEKILEYGLQEALLPQLQDVEKLPEMTDSYQLTALRILIAITSAALISRPEILLPIVLTQVHLCLQHGHSALSSFSYSWYGALLCTDTKTIDKGYHSGKLALKFLEQFPSSSLKCPVYNMFHVFVKPWKEAAITTLNPLIEGMQNGLEVGDLVYSSYCVENYCTYLFIIGKDLTNVEQKQTQYIDLMQKIKNDYAACNIRIWKQLNDNLQGRAVNPCQLSGNSFDEVTMLPQLQAAKIGWTLFNVYLAKGILLYLLEDYGQAISSIALAAESAISVGAWMPVATNNFYYSLALLAKYSNIKVGELEDHISQVKANQERLKHWAHHAPSNFQHKYDLVEAEKYRVLGKNYEAGDWYDRAIFLAKENGYTQEEALANELAAKFYLHWGKEKFAAGYMQEAYYGYARWGAKVKTDDLEQRYPQLLTPIIQQPNLVITPQTTTSTVLKGTLKSTTPTQNIWLDFPAVIKAAQAISGEIELEKLIATLMQIAIANAGAQTGTLILRQDEQWLVVAKADRDKTETLQVLVNECQEVPQSVIYYVARTQKPAVFEDLSASRQFAGDRYIITHQPKSVLCIPISKQGKILGILYLENNLTVGAFSCDRVELLQLLTSQAAISIENARLYQQIEKYSQSLEVEVERKTQELAESKAELLALFAAMEDVVLVLDDRGTYVKVAPTNPDLLYRPAADLEGKTMQDVLSPSAAEFFVKQIRRTLELGQTTSVDYSLNIGDRAIWFDAKVTPFGQNSVLWMARDISDRKRIEANLQQSEAQLRQKALDLEQALQNLQQTQALLIQSEKMSSLGQLVAGIAHEINNPVNFISGNLNHAESYVKELINLIELYQQEYPQPSAEIQTKIEEIELDYLLDDLTKLLQSMKVGSDRISRIILSLRNFSRLDESAMKAVDIHSGIESTLLILQHTMKASANQPEIQVLKEYGNLPVVTCYPSQLNQVFMHIISNAIDAVKEIKDPAKNPQIRIRTSVIENNRVRMAIADNGCGIPADIQSRIFDPFFTTKQVGSGTGLGLFISYSIIKKHGGELTCNSTVNEGTEFAISIPIANSNEMLIQQQ
jgi:PAS domain S-box-containing protein